MEERHETSFPLARISGVHGVKTLESGADLRQLLDSEHLFWIGVVGGKKPTQAGLLQQLGLEDADIGWALRFGASRPYYHKPRKIACCHMAGQIGQRHYGNSLSPDAELHPDHLGT